MAVLVSLAEAQRDLHHLAAACATLAQVCYLEPHDGAPLAELQRLQSLPLSPAEPPLTLQLLAALAAPAPPHAAPPHLQPLFFAAAQPPPPPLSHAQHPSFYGSEYGGPRASYLPPGASAGLGGGAFGGGLGAIPEEPHGQQQQPSSRVPSVDSLGDMYAHAGAADPRSRSSHLDHGYGPPSGYGSPQSPHSAGFSAPPVGGEYYSGATGGPHVGTDYDTRASLQHGQFHPTGLGPYDPPVYPPPPPYDHAQAYPPPPPVYQPPPTPMYEQPPSGDLFGGGLQSKQRSQRQSAESVDRASRAYGRGSLVLAAMDETERAAKAFGKLGHAIAKWEKEHPALHFRDFAATFDASKQGNLSQEELLKMLSKMRTASKVSDKDLAAIWTRLDKYRDPSSGFVKVSRAPWAWPYVCFSRGLFLKGSARISRLSFRQTVASTGQPGRSVGGDGVVRDQPARGEVDRGRRRPAGSGPRGQKAPLHLCHCARPNLHPGQLERRSCVGRRGQLTAVVGADEQRFKSGGQIGAEQAGEPAQRRQQRQRHRARPFPRRTRARESQLGKRAAAASMRATPSPCAVGVVC